MISLHWSGGCSSALKIIVRDKWISAQGVWRGSQLTTRLRCHPISHRVSLISAPYWEEGAAVARLLALAGVTTVGEKKRLAFFKMDTKVHWARPCGIINTHTIRQWKSGIYAEKCWWEKQTRTFDRWVRRHGAPSLQVLKLSRAAGSCLSCSSATGRTYNKVSRQSNNSREAPAPSK